MQQQEQQMPLQVTIAEAARLLSYSKRKVEQLLQRGDLKSVGRGRLRRVAIKELERWQKQNEE